MDLFSVSNDYFYLATKESHLTDSEYRYKIKKPIISVSGKTGNKTTFFENSEYFAQKMNVTSDYIGKYIACKVASSSSFDKSKNCLTFRGEYDKESIEKYLIEFMKIFVLCPNCDYPEIILYLDEKKMIGYYCKACGGNFMIDVKKIDKNAYKVYEHMQKNLKQKKSEINNAEIENLN